MLHVDVTFLNLQQKTSMLLFDPATEHVDVTFGSATEDVNVTFRFQQKKDRA